MQGVCAHGLGITDHLARRALVVRAVESFRELGILFHPHLDVPAETAGGEHKRFFGREIQCPSAPFDLHPQNGALRVRILPPDPGNLGPEDHLCPALLGDLLERLGVVLPPHGFGKMAAVGRVPAASGEHVAKFEAAFVDHPVQGGRGFVDQDLHQFGDVVVIAPLEGVVEMLFGGVVAQIQLCAKLQFVVVGTVAAAVDDGVPAVDGHLLEDDGLGTRPGRLRRRRQPGKPRADYDHVPGLIPLGGKFPDHGLCRPRRCHVQCQASHGGQGAKSCCSL